MNQTEWILDLISKSPYATGADFSHHKGNWDLSKVDMEIFEKVMDFIVLRAGYGAQNGGIYKDVNFDKNYSIASKLGIPLGAYWYFSSHSDWKRQLGAFLLFCEGKDFSFFVMDFEQYYNEKSSVFALNTIKFMKELQTRFPNKRIILYANRYDYKDWLSPYTSEGKNFPFWIAQYPYANWANGLTDQFKSFWEKVFLTLEYKPTMPPERQANDWEMWQVVSASNIGIELGFDSDELDFNITRRKKQEFYDWLSFVSQPEPPVPPIPEPPVPPEPIEHEHKVEVFMYPVDYL